MSTEVREMTYEERTRPIHVNGVTVTLGSFLCLNEGISLSEREELLAMEPGEVRTFGGGAFATYEIERID